MKLLKANVNFENCEPFAFHYRENSLGDRGAIQQVLQNNDYNILDTPQGRRLAEYHHEQSKVQDSLIIDAGANIGAASVYFSHIFKNSFIFALEPNAENYQILVMNSNNLNIHCFHGAISNYNGELLCTDPGRGDWGFMTRALDLHDRASNSVIVQCVSPSSILASPVCENKNPLLLKIDIEGGEDDLFRGDTSWLNKFPLVIIELHDWMLPFSGSSRSFLRAISNYEFDFIHRGENIFLFNRELL